MQDPPSLLPEMYRIITTEDVDNVATRRTTREGEPPIRSLFARMFYKLINKISKATRYPRRISSMGRATSGS